MGQSSAFEFGDGAIPRIRAIVIAVVVASVCACIGAIAFAVWYFGHH